MDYFEFENALQLVNSVKVLSEAMADSPNLADLNCASIFRMIHFVLENAEQPLQKALAEMIDSGWFPSDSGGLSEEAPLFRETESSPAPST